MYFLIFILGGLSYNILEYFWRGHSHWSMTIDGGICLVGIYLICTKTELNFIYKIIAGALFITAVEFVSWAYLSQNVVRIIRVVPHI